MVESNFNYCLNEKHTNLKRKLIYSEEKEFILMTWIKSCWTINLKLKAEDEFNLVYDKTAIKEKVN